MMKLSTISLLIAVFMAACGGTSTSGGSGGAGATGSGSTSASGTTSASGSTSSSSTGAGGGLPAGKCRSSTDCMNGEFCGVVNLPPFCGGQCDNTFNNDCQSDADCADAGTNLICDIPCKCPHGGAQPSIHCTKGCATDADCGPSMACSATHRCEAAACAQPGDCTANFTCADSPNGKRCAVKACMKDADCSGFCVLGFCSPTLGTCAPAVP